MLSYVGDKQPLNQFRRKPASSWLNWKVKRLRHCSDGDVVEAVLKRPIKGGRCGQRSSYKRLRDAAACL
jgi:hypothetical protein